MASVHRVRGLFPSALHCLDKQVLTEQLHTNPLGEILNNAPRAADKWNSYATWEHKRPYTHTHTLSLTHMNAEAWSHRMRLTHRKLDKAKKSVDSKRKWDKERGEGRKMVSKNVKVIDVSLDTDVCLPMLKIILLSFKRHKITGWEIIVHKRTLDTCSHDQNTWLKKWKHSIAN